MIGVKEFWGVDFQVNGGRLGPRAGTETVVEAVRRLLDRAQAR